MLFAIVQLNGDPSPIANQFQLARSTFGVARKWLPFVLSLPRLRRFVGNPGRRAMRRQRIPESEMLPNAGRRSDNAGWRRSRGSQSRTLRIPNLVSNFVLMCRATLKARLGLPFACGLFGTDRPNPYLEPAVVFAADRGGEDSLARGRGGAADGRGDTQRSAASGGRRAVRSQALRPLARAVWQ